MSTPFLQGDGPFLGPLSEGTEVLEPGFEVKKQALLAPSKLTIEPGTFVDLKTKIKKAFYDDLPLPESSNQDLDLGSIKTPDLNCTKKPSFVPQNYEIGKVKVASKEAIENLANAIKRLPPTTTGVIVEEGFEPECDQYTEGCHFLLEKTLSKGSFGTGALCIDSGGQNKKFFHKKMNPINFRSSEVVVPIHCNHENLTKVYGLINRHDEDEEHIIELMIEPAGTALNNFVNQFVIDTPKIWDITKQTMAGLNHMHRYEMIHHDLKPENLCVQMFGDRLLVKITDFGSAKLPMEPVEFIGWTPEYMAPETSQLLLHVKGIQRFTGISENHITGKIDVFAGALVVMYLIEKVHVLQRLISNGKNSYTGLKLEIRTEMQVNLMKMLAMDPNFVQSIIPDRCDIDMRDLLINMTQYNYQQRFSAQQAINFIEGRERRQKELILECSRRLQLQQLEKLRLRAQEPVNTTPDIDYIAKELEVPGIAYDCLETETGPIKMNTRDRLRDKIKKPYSGKGKGKMMKEETPVQEMKRLHAASKRMDDDFPPPPTPVTDVSLSMAKLQMEMPIQATGISERNALVTQPMTEDASLSVAPSTSGTQVNCASVVMNQRADQMAQAQPTEQQATVELGKTRQRGSYKVLPPVTMPQSTQNEELMGFLSLLIKNGQLKIATTEKGPMPVLLTQGTQPTPAARRGTTPFMPASPPAGQPMELDLLGDHGAMDDVGNVPDFLKLG